ncbi:MAG: hypothetical protein NVSMB29_09500 [Candidatus Dormibacteria bacterium]
MPALEGRTVAVLQARHGDVLADLIRRNGGQPVLAPCLREVRSDDRESLTTALWRVDREAPDMAIFQTGVGTEALFEFAADAGLEGMLTQRLAEATVLARGPKPLAVLHKHGVRVDLRTREPHTTADVIALVETHPAPRAVLVQHYGASNTALLDHLRARSTVIEVFTYAWALPDDLAPVLGFLRRLEEGELDATLFTSASQVENLHLIAEQAGSAAALSDWLNRRTATAAVGPTTAHALEERGVTPVVQPVHPKMAPLVRALCEHFSPRLEPQPGE